MGPRGRGGSFGGPGGPRGGDSRGRGGPPPPPPRRRGLGPPPPPPRYGRRSCPGGCGCLTLALSAIAAAMIIK